MSNVKISALPVAASILSTDIVPAVNAAGTVKATIAQLGSHMPIPVANLTGLAANVPAFLTTALDAAVATWLNNPTGSDLAAALTTPLPASGGGTGVGSLGSGIAAFLQAAINGSAAAWLTTPSGANLAAALTSALPASKGGTGVTSLGSGIAAFLQAAIDAAANTWLTTPSGANLAAALTSPLPPSGGGTGIAALAAGIATWLGTPSGANLAAALTTPLPASGGGTGVAALGTNVPTFLGTALPPLVAAFLATPSGANLAAALTTALPATKGGTGNTSIGTNVATFLTAALPAAVATLLGTFTSANLAAALSDETGTGACVFGTSPTFKTSVVLNNPANTFAYSILSDAIAANRNLTLPLVTSNDIFVTAAFVQSLTNKTIVAASNTITDTGATLGDLFYFDGTHFVRLPRGGNGQFLRSTGTTIDWETVSVGGGSAGANLQMQTSDGAGGFTAPTDVFAGADWVLIGCPVASGPSSGNLRLVAGGSIVGQKTGGVGDIAMVTLDTGNRVSLGGATGIGDYVYITPQGGDGGLSVTGQFVYDTGSGQPHLFQNAGTTYFSITSAGITSRAPMTGDTAVGLYGAVDGTSTIAMANANHTITPAELANATLIFTGANTAVRTALFPVPAAGTTYRRLVWNQTSTNGTTCSIGSGTTLVLPVSDSPKWAVFSPTGVVKSI